MQASPPTGYIEIEPAALRLLALGDSDIGSRASCTASITGGGQGSDAAAPGLPSAGTGDARDHAGAAGGSTQRQWARLVQPGWAVTSTGLEFLIHGCPSEMA